MKLNDLYPGSDLYMASAHLEDEDFIDAEIVEEVSDGGRGKSRPAKTSTGRPTSLTPELQDRIVDLLNVGVSKGALCEALDLSEHTLRYWLARADDDVEPYRTFRTRFREAENKQKVWALKILEKAANADPVKAWKAAAFILERRWPREFGTSGQLDLNVNNNGPVEVDLSKLTDEEIAILANIRKKLAAKNQ